MNEAEDRISGLEEQMGLRESEIRAYERQINDLSVNVAALESEVDSLKEENHGLRVDLEATKELCQKLDLQKDKLNAELEEHSAIRQQLDKDNEKLRRELTFTKAGDKAAADGLQELLASSRSEVEEQRIIASQLNAEIIRLREQVDELKVKLKEEHANRSRNEALAREYDVQLQEAKRMITDERFAQLMHSRDDDDARYSTL